MAPLITVENLCKEFNGTKVLKNISFEIDEGEILGIIGRSGAGKTVLMQDLRRACGGKEHNRPHVRRQRAQVRQIRDCHRQRRFLCRALLPDLRRGRQSPERLSDKVFDCSVIFFLFQTKFNVVFGHFLLPV